MNRMFDPGPKTHAHLVDRLNRRNDLKYRDYSTALDFTLKATPPKSEGYEQEILFRAENIFEPPQDETLFGPDLLV